MEMLNYSIKSRLLSKNIDLLYSYKLSCFLVKGFSGVFILRLPSFYFCANLNKESIILVFLTRFFFKSFIKHLYALSNRLSIVYFIKLRIRGLGFRIRSISDIIYYFFFNYTNYYYLYSPKTLLIRVYKKRMLFISFDWFLLKLVLGHILLLRKIGPYNLLGLRLRRQIVFLKKSGKKV